MVSTADIDGILKKVYSPEEVENIQNRETVLWKGLNNSSKKPTGLGFEMSVTVKGNQRGQGSQNELEALRIPGKQSPIKPLVTNKVFTHTIRTSGLAKEISTSNEDSFIDNITYQTEEGIADSAKELNAQLFRDGSGKVADVAGAVVAANVITFDGGVPTHFQVGTYIDVVLAGVAEADSVEITDVDPFAKTITLASNVTVSDNAGIYREDVWRDAPVDGKELAGLPLVTDDGSVSAIYQNVDRTAFPTYSGITIDAGAANLSDDLLQQAQARVQIVSGKKVTKLVMNPQQVRKYLDIVTPFKRFVKETTEKTEMDSGMEVMPTWNGLPIMVDTDCGYDEVYGLDCMYLKKFETRKLSLDDTTGEIFRWDNGFDAFVILIKEYGNLGAEGGPNCHFRLKNLAEPASL
jgi:hypothetical protein